jgi:hypothetical protein
MIGQRRITGLPTKKAGTPSTHARRPGTRDYADADTKPNARSDAATPRTPPPRTSNCPAAADGQTMTGTETRHDRTRPPITGPCRTATDRLSSRDHDCANADATAISPNDATATVRLSLRRSPAGRRMQRHPPRHKATPAGPQRRPHHRRERRKPRRRSHAEPPNVKDEGDADERRPHRNPTTRTATEPAADAQRPALTYRTATDTNPVSSTTARTAADPTADQKPQPNDAPCCTSRCEATYATA